MKLKEFIELLQSNIKDASMVKPYDSDNMIIEFTTEDSYNIYIVVEDTHDNE